MHRMCGFKRNYWESSLIGVLLLIGMCTSDLELKENNGTLFTSCLTWEDDQNFVNLTCRVSNLFEPVTFFHDDHNTKVKCFLKKHDQSCSPNTDVAVDRYNGTVTISIMKKKHGHNLEGRWYCVQGGNIKSTEVSLTRGIIVDTMIKLRCNASFDKNGHELVTLECSSCRNPIGNYAEFIVNNKTVASVWKIDSNDCWHKNSSCSSQTCSCSQSGNTFIVQAHSVNTSSNISCHMLFKDSFRGGIFSIRASKMYTGEDFVITGTNTNVLKENRPNSYATRITSPVRSGQEKTEPTKATSTFSSIPTKKPTISGSEGRCSTGTIALTVFSTLVVASLFSIMVYTIFRYRREKKGSKIIRRSSDYEMTERRPLLTIPCKSCELKEGNFLCFHCRQRYCKDCKTNVHKLCRELSVHKILDTSCILPPSTFSIMMFNCKFKAHVNECCVLKYYCMCHLYVFCEICKEHRSLTCKLFLICDIGESEIDSFLSNLFNMVKAFEDYLGSSKLLQNDYLNSFYLKTNEMYEGFDSSKPRTVSFRMYDSEVIENNVDLTRVQMNRTKTEYTEIVHDSCKRIDNLLSEISERKETLQFLSKHVGNDPLMIAAFLFQQRISEMKEGIKTNLSLGYIIEIESDFGDDKISVNKKKLLSVINIPTFELETTGWI